MNSDAGCAFRPRSDAGCCRNRTDGELGNQPTGCGPSDGKCPDPARETDSDRKADIESSLDYMDLTPGMSMTDIKVDKVFVGACTNARIEDLRPRRRLRRAGRQVETLIVPGSGLVKKQAEEEGLDQFCRCWDAVASTRLFHVLCFERRYRGVWRTRCGDQQPELSRATGPRKPHAFGEPGDGRRGVRHGTDHRCTQIDGRRIIMEPFTSFKAIAVPIDIPNCDTDQIIPVRFVRNGTGRPGLPKILSP